MSIITSSSSSLPSQISSSIVIITLINTLAITTIVFTTVLLLIFPMLMPILMVLLMPMLMLKQSPRTSKKQSKAKAKQSEGKAKAKQARMKHCQGKAKNWELLASTVCERRQRSPGRTTWRWLPIAPHLRCATCMDADEETRTFIGEMLLSLSRRGVGMIITVLLFAFLFSRQLWHILFSAPLPGPQQRALQHQLSSSQHRLGASQSAL